MDPASPSLRNTSPQIYAMDGPARTHARNLVSYPTGQVWWLSISLTPTTRTPQSEHYSWHCSPGGPWIGQQPSRIGTPKYETHTAISPSWFWRCLRTLPGSHCSIFTRAQIQQWTKQSWLAWALKAIFCEGINPLPQAKLTCRDKYTSLAQNIMLAFCLDNLVLNQLTHAHTMNVPMSQCLQLFLLWPSQISICCLPWEADCVSHQGEPFHLSL